VLGEQQCGAGVASGSDDRRGLPVRVKPGRLIGLVALIAEQAVCGCTGTEDEVDRVDKGFGGANWSSTTGFCTRPLTWSGTRRSSTVNLSFLQFLQVRPQHLHVYSIKASGLMALRFSVAWIASWSL
jgi:hypothetical protein